MPRCRNHIHHRYHEAGKGFSSLLNDQDPLLFSRGLMVAPSGVLMESIEQSAAWVTGPLSMFCQGDDQEIGQRDIGERNERGVITVWLCIQRWT